MDDDPQVRCPTCDAIFTVIWNYAPETIGGPEYCPFCSDEIDYGENKTE